MIVVNELNKYVFSRPEIVDLLSLPGREFNDYSDDNVPVFPINEVPESDAPYTLYLWKAIPPRNFYALKREDITYSMWDIDIYRLQQYETQLIRYLGQEDVSAEAFRHWYVKQPGNHPIDIKSIQLLGSTDPYSEEQEGGVVGKNITFRVEYVDCVMSAPII